MKLRLNPTNKKTTKIRNIVNIRIINNFDRTVNNFVDKDFFT